MALFVLCLPCCINLADYPKYLMLPNLVRLVAMPVLQPVSFLYLIVFLYSLAKGLL